MGFAKVMLLAVLLVLLCIFMPGGQTGMEEYMGMGAETGMPVTVDSLKETVRLRIAKMRSIGITEANEQVEEAVVEGCDGYPPELIENMFDGPHEMFKVDGIIFSYIGLGTYDYENWEWTPSSGQVYIFDMEVFNIGSMYTDFLHGVLALAGNDLTVTDVEEDCSEVDEEEGTGTQILRFKCNGTPYEFRGEAYYDWMDMKVIDFMNEVLKKEGIEKRLLASFDGGQGCILFYNTKEWGEEFEEVMGYELLNME